MSVPPFTCQNRTEAAVIPVRQFVRYLLHNVQYHRFRPGYGTEGKYCIRLLSTRLLVDWQGLGLRANPAIQASIEPSDFPAFQELSPAQPNLLNKLYPPNPPAHFMTEVRRHVQLFGELQSINQAVAQLSTIGVSLDTIIELLKQPALHRSDDSDRGAGSDSATLTVPLLANLDAEY